MSFDNSWMAALRHCTQFKSARRKVGSFALECSEVDISFDPKSRAFPKASAAFAGKVGWVGSVSSNFSVPSRLAARDRRFLAPAETSRCPPSQFRD
jgi:hypothetical protein